MPRLSVNHAAAHLNVSPDTILRRIKAHNLVGTKDNRGKWWVFLPDDPVNDAPAPTAESAELRCAAVTPRGPQDAEPPSEMATLVTTLTGMVETMQRQHRDALALLTERVDAAECRAEQAEQRLFEILSRLSRPWWRRWFRD